MRRDSETTRADEGTQLGAYRLVEPIGQGGMGVVWLAEHTLIGRRAAIKLLRPDLSASDEVVTRFFNEARAAAAISDPGIVQIFDFGYAHDGGAYLVMELLEGETLAQRVERAGPLAVGDALRLVRQIAGSLGAAHARGIFHRDLKPENIFIVRDPAVPGGERAKILDFGIAKLVDDHIAVKTNTSVLLGTPMYMSPEQCRGGGTIDRRTDIYTLGCVLYMALCGQPPFDAEGVGELLAKHMMEPPVRPSLRRKGIPREVEAVLAVCMAKDPAARYPDGAALAAALDGVIPHEPPAMSESARLRKNTTLSSSVGAMMPLPDDDEPPRPRRRRIDMWIAISVVAFALVVGIAGLVAFPSGSRAPHPAASAATPAPVAPSATPIPPSDIAKQQIAATLAAFRSWAPGHAGAPCPSHGELAELVPGGVVDPWGHPLIVTCTDQPADQMIGVSSAGPDGVAGTSDDLASWNLGPEAADLVRGERWHHATHTAVKPAAPNPPRPAARPSFSGTTLGDDGIPTSR
ncbi:MAG TPA: serine/threonine-protein kinase [Kofleriaceae bacterium]|nr:serine/threonine-protein kinase [Kofleriaceae bacterium]